MEPRVVIVTRPTELEDLLKAREYLDFAIAQLSESDSDASDD